MYQDHLLSVIEGDMRDGGEKRTKAESIEQSKHHTQVKLAVVIVSIKIDIKVLLVEDTGNVIGVSSLIKGLGGIEGKLLRIVSIRPVKDRQNNVQEDEESGKEVGYGEKRNSQWTA